MKTTRFAKRFRISLIVMAMVFLCVALLPSQIQAGIGSFKDKPLKQRVYGKPLGSNVINMDSVDSFHLGFKLNNQENRVGLLLEVCKDPTGMYNRNCQEILYYFPDLTYDGKKSEILLGKEVVAKFSGSDESTAMYKPFTFSYEVEDKLVDDGFNMYKRKAVKLYLGKDVSQD